MRSVLFAAALALATTTASAQTVATVFSDLPTVVKSGDTVDVTDAKGRTLRGKIGELSPTSLELTARTSSWPTTEATRNSKVAVWWDLQACARW
jgi:hypothetical protein